MWGSNRNHVLDDLVNKLSLDGRKLVVQEGLAEEALRVSVESQLDGPRMVWDGAPEVELLEATLLRPASLVLNDSDEFGLTLRNKAEKQPDGVPKDLPESSNVGGSNLDGLFTLSAFSLRLHQNGAKIV